MLNDEKRWKIKFIDKWHDVFTIFNQTMFFPNHKQALL